MNTCTPQKTPTPSPLRNGNRQGDPSNAPRCGAKTRAGTPCKSPAMKNGRCRMHGGKCRGPTTPEGRARISAARDQGRGWAKKYKAQNDAVAAIVRRTRVFTAMSDAKMQLAEIAPLIQDLRGTIGRADPGYAADSPASASSYAAEATLALAGDRLAMRALTHAIHEAGHRRRAALRLARSGSRKTRKNAMHRESARAEPAKPPTTPATNPTPPPATLNRKQRRRLAKLSKASHAPRAASPQMTRRDGTAKRPP